MNKIIILTAILTIIALIYECIHKCIRKRKRKLFWDLMSHCTGHKDQINSIIYSVLKRNNYKEMKKLLNTLHTNKLWEATKDLII